MTTIQCECKVCQANAAQMGVPLPLRAQVPAPLLEACKGEVHGLVFSAHDPSIVGTVTRRQTGIRPA